MNYICVQYIKICNIFLEKSQHPIPEAIDDSVKAFSVVVGWQLESVHVRPSAQSHVPLIYSSSSSSSPTIITNERVISQSANVYQCVDKSRPGNTSRFPRWKFRVFPAKMPVFRSCESCRVCNAKWKYKFEVCEFSCSVLGDVWMNNWIFFFLKENQSNGKFLLFYCSLGFVFNALHE